MLVVLLFSINAINPEFIAAQDLELTPPSTSNPFPTPYQGKQVNKSQKYPRRDISLNKGQDNLNLISEHMNLMKLVNIMRGIFYVKSINSEQNYDLKNAGLYSEFRRAHNNTYSMAKYSNKPNIAGKSKLKSRNQNSSDNGKRKVYGEKKSWIQFSTKNDPNDFNREIKNSYRDKLIRKKKNLDKSLQEIAKGQVHSDFSMKEKEKTKHDNKKKKDGFTENIKAQKTEIEDAYSASNSSKERIHGQGHLIKFNSTHS